MGVAGVESQQSAEEPGEQHKQREEERYLVSGNAEVFLNGGTSMVRGRIVNLSLSGCYIQSAAPVKLSTGTTVDIVAAVRGLPIRVSAEARSSKPRFGMGFLFIAMTDETRRRLAKLISQLQAEGQIDPDPRTMPDDPTTQP